MTPRLIVERDELAVGVDGRTQLGEQGRAIVVPAELVSATELQSHGSADFLRKDRGRVRGLAVATVAVGVRARGVLHADLVERQAQQRRKAEAREVDRLARADHERGIARHVGDRAVRRHRSVRLIRPAIRGRDDVRCARQRVVHVAGFGVDEIVGLRGAEAIEQALVAGKLRRERLPRDLQLARSTNGVPLALRDHADEMVPANDPHARNVRDRRLVDARDRRVADAVRPLPARPYDAAVQHSGQTDVLNVSIGAADLFGDVGPRHASAHETKGVTRLRLCVAYGLARQLDAAVVGVLLERPVERPSPTRSA